METGVRKPYVGADPLQVHSAGLIGVSHMWLFLAFLAVPLIEITLFIKIGGAIGLGWTLVTVIITAILGTYFVRSQGVATIGRLQSSFSDMKDPTEPLVHGAMILFAGALLLTPGFFTDFVGFSLMVPQIRTFMFNAMRKRVKVSGFKVHGQPPQGFEQSSDVIEGEFEDLTDTKRPDGPSGWTKH